MLALNSAGRQTTHRLRSALWLAVKLALLAVVLLFVMRALADRFAKLDWAEHRPNPWWLMGAAGLLLAGDVLFGVGYRSLLGAFSAPPPWPAVFAVAWVSKLGKYLPGKVASVVGAAWLLKKHNVPTSVGMASNLIIIALFVIIGLLVSTPLLLQSHDLPGGFSRLGFAALLAGGLVCLHPRVFVGGANFALRILGRDPIRVHPRLRDYLVPALMLLVQWVLFGMAFWFAAQSVHHIGVERLPHFVSGAALAATLGFVAVFAPAGVGVREGIFMLVVEPVADASAVAIAVVTIRLFQTLVELALAGIGLLILRRSAPAAAGGQPELEPRP